MNIQTIDLGWGESVAVRQAFLSTMACSKMHAPLFNIKALTSLGYPKHEGDVALVELTHQVIERQLGKTYRHVLITNGATGGVTIALRAYKLYRETGFCATEGPPYFRLYPDMIRAAGMERLDCHSMSYLESLGMRYKTNMVLLIDSPSNPLGVFSTQKKDLRNNPIIWDHTYFNRIYCPGNHPQPDHDILVGSYGKLTGLNGLRVGWLATNDSLLYERLRTLVAAEYCGISAPSTKIILETAGLFNGDQWATFELKANLALDGSRGEWSKLEKFFGNRPVIPVGMFYYAPIDTSCRRLLEKSNIVWSPGSILGTTDDFGRFNLGQDPKMVKLAVKTILKNDKI
jgi:aspartate/methionine/tyrosine aminotransferase